MALIIIGILILIGGFALQAGTSRHRGMRMRAFRGLSIALLLLLNVGQADAQASRGFKESWFWGFKTGLLAYQVVDNGV